MRKLYSWICRHFGLRYQALEKEVRGSILFTHGFELQFEVLKMRHRTVRSQYASFLNSLTSAYLGHKDHSVRPNRREFIFFWKYFSLSSGSWVPWVLPKDGSSRQETVPFWLVLVIQTWEWTASTLAADTHLCQVWEGVGWGLSDEQATCLETGHSR